MKTVFAGRRPPAQANILALIAALAVGLPSAPAHAAPHADDVCTINTATRLWAEARRFPVDLWKRPTLYYAYSRLPVGGQAEIAVAGQKMPSEEHPSFSTLRIIVTDAASEAAYDQAAPSAADPAGPAATADAAPQDANKTAADPKARLDDEQRKAVAAAAAAAVEANLQDEVQTTFVSGVDVTPSAAESDDPLVQNKRIDKGDLLATFTVPSPYAGEIAAPLIPHRAKLMIIGCDTSNKVVFISSAKEIPVSGWLASVLLAFLPATIIYVLVGTAAWRSDLKKKEEPAKPEESFAGWLRSLDPVCMSSAQDGRASLGRLQIMFFTLLLSIILAFLLVRIGFLSDMSSTVLELLGISAVGATASKATDGTRTRLSAENWAWLTSRKWLPERGLAPYTTARWSELVTSPEDGFDVYHFQMLVFSLVVGFALFQAGYGGIAGFKIPDALLGVLGLSQVAYVGGKLAAPRNFADFDKLLDQIRDLEVDYTKACSDQEAAATPTTPEARKAQEDLVSKRNAAEEAFQAQMSKVKAYFVTVFGTFDEIKRIMNPKNRPNIDLTPDWELPRRSNPGG